MAVTMKNVVSWDVTSCTSCKIRRFWGTYRLHDQGGKNQRARNVSSFFRLDYGSDTFLRNVSCYESHTPSHPRRRHSSMYWFFLEVEILCAVMSVNTWPTVPSPGDGTYIIIITYLHVQAFLIVAIVLLTVERIYYYYYYGIISYVISLMCILVIIVIFLSLI
jgi:hypothetical protein